MNVSQIVSEIDQEIARLTNARNALLSIAGAAPVAARRGRPKGSKNPAAASAAKKHGISPEGRKRIAEAMKRRWAAKKAAGKKNAVAK